MVYGVRIRKHRTDVACTAGAKYGIGDRVGDSIAIRVTMKMHFRWNRDTTEDERATRRETVGIVADARSVCQSLYRLIARVALCPPKPKLLLMTALISRSAGLFGV